MTRPLALVLALTLVGLAPTFAAAQQDRGTVYISAGAFAAIERAPSSTGFAGVDDSGTVPGGMLGLGVHLTPRVSARVEWSMTGELDIAQSYAYPAQLLLEPGVSSLPISDFRFSVPGGESRRRTTSGYALLGYHVTGRRLGLEVLGGVGLVNEDTTTEYDVRILARAIFPAPMPELKTSSYSAVAVVGADLAVSLTRRASVVPSFRAYALNGGLSVRPGVALRWTF